MVFADQSRGFDGFSAAFRLGHEDGYATYRIRTRWNEGAPAHDLELVELCAATEDAHLALWHTLLGIDLVGSIRSRRSVPLDDALPHLLQNPRAVRTEGLDDNLWLRPHRPGVLLGARTYGTEDRLVLEVTSDAIDVPSGRWEVEGGPDGAAASRTRRRADLSLDRATLGAISLGGVRPSVLARGRRISEATSGALRRADAFFAAERLPTCQNPF
jgi:predicted acetyltransferase